MNFLAPLGLALGALAAPLAALYFLRIRRRKVKVPSLLLWHALKQSEKLASPFERFRRHLLLLLQLMLLAAITLAFARPYLETDVAQFRSVVLVIDGSASMGATDLEPTRFEAARDQAEDVIDSLGVVDEVMVVYAGATTKVAAPFTRDLGAARQAVRDLQLSEAEGNLAEGLQLAFSLAKSRPDVEVIVYSDGGGEDLSAVSTGGASVKYVMTGGRSANAGIIALDLRRSPTSDLQQQLFVTVQNYGRQSTKGTVEVYLQSEMLGLRTEELPTDSPVSMVFDLPASAAGIVQVKLDADRDLLEADNEAWALVDAAALRKVLLVGGDRLTARALSADPRLDLKRIRPGAVTRSLLDEQDAIVFDGPVPDNVDGLSYMVLSPEHGGPVVFGDEVRAPRVLGWRRTHPVMRFVEWEGVTIARARKVSEQAGLVPLVEADTGPLVLAGERGGGRVVQLAFDPLKSDLPLRVAWPVLILNSVGWLTEDVAGSATVQLVPTGATWARRLPVSADPATITATGPDGKVAVQTSDGFARIGDTHAVGVYNVRLGDERIVFAANLLSQRESNISPRPTLGLSEGATNATAAAKVAQGRRELWRPLLLFGLLVLMVEWFIWNRRKVA